LFIPPLMSPAGFRRYSIEVDKPLIDLIHNAGGQVWVHCHGRMRAVIEGFVEMGVDVLNPIEPPPMGDVTVAEAFEIVGRRMGLEGGIETHDLMTATPEQLQAKIHQDLREGAGKRFIYCPSSGFDEDAEPTPRHIDNLLYFVEESVRFAESLAK